MDESIKLIKINNKNSNKNNSNKNNSNKNNSNKNSNKNNSNNNTDTKNTKNIKNNKKISYKISDTEYEKPDITYTEKLTKTQIQELLADYEKINDINELKNVPIGTHIRYFDIKNNEMKFRTGGILTVNNGLPEYIILSSGHLSWSVQVKTSILFRRITVRQIKEEFQKEIINMKATIKGLQQIIYEKNKYITELEKILKINNIKIKKK